MSRATLSVPRWGSRSPAAASQPSMYSWLTASGSAVSLGRVTSIVDAVAVIAAAVDGAGAETPRVDADDVEPLDDLVGQQQPHGDGEVGRGAAWPARVDEQGADAVAAGQLARDAGLGVSPAGSA